MKLIIQNNLIAATATDEYQPAGQEQAVIFAPAGFDITKMAYYTFANGAVTLNSAQVEYESLLSGGIVLTSTGTPALNGTYSVTAPAQHNISGIMSGIANGLGLPGGGSTFQYQDMSGKLHAWSATAFPELARAVRDFVYNCDVTLTTIQAAGVATFPSNQVTIA